MEAYGIARIESGFVLILRSYVIINNEGEVLRKLPGMDSNIARTYGSAIFELAQKARHTVRDLDVEVSELP